MSKGEVCSREKKLGKAETDIMEDPSVTQRSGLGRLWGPNTGKLKGGGESLLPINPPVFHLSLS